ncbi:MAG: hypothetical protein AAGG75_27915 [Bacteroidota bacterium]
MNRLLLLYSLLPFLYACNSTPQVPPEQLIINFYQACKEQHYAIVNDYLLPDPDTLVIPDSNYMQQLYNFAWQQNGHFQKVSFDLLNDQPKDKALYFEIDKITRATGKLIYGEPVLHSYPPYQTDPGVYNVGAAIRQQLRVLQSSDSFSVEFLKTDLRAVPLYYETAKANLIKVEIKKIKNAIEQNSDTYFLLAKNLPRYISDLSLSEKEKNKLLRVNEQARLAVKDYIAYCNSLTFEYFDNE